MTTSKQTRREFLRRGMMGTVGVTLAANLPRQAQAAARKKIPVGLQLYSLRNQLSHDLAGNLEIVAKTGYQGVEFADYYGRSARELRKLLDQNGLVACGSHIYLESVQGDKLKETVEFNRVLGNRFLIIRWMVGKSKPEWLDHAKAVNEVAGRLKAEGMSIGYHAHAHDFEKFEGQPAWDLFFGHTVPEVIMQLDTANCCEGGANPVAVLKKYPGRARSIHLKAFGAGPEAVIGEDKVDWRKVFAFCEGKGRTEWYVLEHESSQDPVDAIKRSFAALRALGKA